MPAVEDCMSLGALGSSQFSERRLRLSGETVDPFTRRRPGEEPGLDVLLTRFLGHNSDLALAAGAGQLCCSIVLPGAAENQT